MLKKLHNILILFLLFTFCNGQEWSANIMVDPFPSPYLSDWQSDPTIVQLEITNESDEQDVVIVYLEVKDGDGSTLLQSHSKRLLVSSMETLFIGPLDYSNWNITFVNSNFKDLTTQTGLFPENDYEASVKVVNLWGTEIIPETYAYFTIAQPDPPELVFPIESEPVFDQNPIFQWLPSQVFSQNQILYTLKIVEILSNQIPSQAIDANYPIYENFNILDNEIEYPIGGFPLVNRKVYCWQVTALDISGKPATKNSGKSEIGTFVYQAESIGSTSAIQLISPMNDEVLFSPSVDFAWIAEGENILNVVKMNNGQTPQMAIQFNSPIISQSTNEKYFSTTLDANQTYAWQVKPIDAFNNNFPINQFFVSQDQQQKDIILSDKLPIVSESTAYIDLSNTRDYRLSEDSSQAEIAGNMMLVLPSLGQTIEVTGNLLFDVASLEIFSGQFSSTNNDFAISNTPLRISKINYDKSVANVLNITGTLSLFGKTFNTIEIPVNLDPSGEISTTIFTNLNEAYRVNDFTIFRLENINGSISGNSALSAINSDIRLKGNLELNSTLTPIEMIWNEDEVSIQNPVNGSGNIIFDEDYYSLELLNPVCEEFRFDNLSEQWEFHIQCNGNLTFEQLKCELSDISGIIITENGTEFPELSITNIQTNQAVNYADVSIFPKAFRMKPETFDPSIQPEFLFDLDIVLPQLPYKFAELNKVPFRINNALYKNGKFYREWSPRTFLSPVEIAITDSLTIYIDQLSGKFISDNGFPSVEMWITGSIQNINFNKEQVSLTSDGFFNGRIDNINAPFDWKNGLKILPQNQSLVLAEDSKNQKISYEIDGKIQFPDFDGNLVEAKGNGEFDLISQKLVSGSFKVDDAFTFGLVPEIPLFGVPCRKNALIDANGLHIVPKDKFLLNEGNEISCNSSNINISLFDWKITSTSVNFSESFNLLMEDLQHWKTTSKNDLPDGNFLLLKLANYPSIIDDDLVAYSSTQSKLRYKGELYDVTTYFSNDFRFSISDRNVKSGKVDLLISGQQVGELNASGLHLGNFFGPTLANQKIGLPDTNTAYINLALNSNILTEDKNSSKRYYTSGNKKAIVHFPSLKYNGDTIPAVFCDIDLLVNPSTNQIQSGTVTSVTDSVLSLVKNKIPILCKNMKYANNEWHSDILPFLPKALRSSTVSAEEIKITSAGISHCESGYSAFASLPQDSVKLSNKLKVLLDGIRFINSDISPKMMISGDFKSSFFNGEKVHFTSELQTDTSEFVIQTLNQNLPLGDAVLDLYDNGNTQSFSVPMSNNDFAVYFGGVMKFNTLCDGFSLDLPKLELSGLGMKLVEKNLNNLKQAQLFGTKVFFDDFDIDFNRKNTFDLVLAGEMALFGDTLNISGIHINGKSEISDTLLSSKDHKYNRLFNLKKFLIENEKLVVDGFVKLPKLFSGQETQNFSLEIDKSGKWSGSDEKSLAILEDAKEFGRNVGDNNFSITGYVSNITLEMENNEKADGSLIYQVDTYWLQEELIASGDSVIVATFAEYTFDENGVIGSWDVEEVEGEISTLLDNNTFLKASNLSMSDTTAFQLNFNATLALPIPSDIINGEIELTGCSLTKNIYTMGQLHTGEAKLPGITVELLDFHFEKDSDVHCSEIEFTETRSDVKDTTYHADYYLSFGGRICTDAPGFNAQIERFVIFKSEDQFHLLINDAALKVGSLWNSNLNLIGSVWEKETGVEFRWLVGGHMGGDLFKGSGINGGAIVGEISYREIINLNGQPEKHPGFGLLLKVDAEIDLKPIPVKLTGFGAGFFWNPSPEIKDLVRSHLGFSSDVTSEFSDIIDSYDDDMMTLWEIYLYGAGVIPEKKTIDAKVLLTLATDRIRIDAKVSPTEELEIGNAIDLTGWLVAECAWKQDFSDFKYFAGHVKIGGKPKGEKFIFTLPETHRTSLDFIVTKEGKFAVAGDLETTMYGQFNIDMGFTFGNPGFVFDGSLGYGFDVAQILKVEAGMDLMVYLYWLDPVKFGGYASLWVEGSVIDEWLAGFRGEMGAALMGAPDFYLYGFAELEGTILGVSKTIRAWAKWEKEGGCTAGTGADPTMEALIAASKEVAEEIMAAVEELKGEMGMVDILAGLSEEEIDRMISRWKTGMGNQYFESWLADVNEMNSVSRETINKLDKDQRQSAENDMGILIDELNKFHPNNYYPNIEALEDNVKELKPILTQIKNDLENRNNDFNKKCKDITSELSGIDFGLDTLLAMADLPQSPFQNPIGYSTTSLEGVNFPEINYDSDIDEQNIGNHANMLKVFEGWLAEIEIKINTLGDARTDFFAVLGPIGKSSELHSNIMKPLLTKNDELITSLTQINIDFKNVYRKYNSLTSPWISDNGLTWFAENEDHRNLSMVRRLMAISLLGITPEDISENPIDAYRQLGNIFYRTIPKVLMQNTIQKTDSLLIKFEQYNKCIQKNIYEQHQILTSQTDLLWNKYAELSSKLYSIMDKYQEYAESYDVENDSVSVKISEMSEEFTFPAIDYNVDVSNIDGFKPTVIDIKTTESENIVEYAATLNNDQPISFGDANQVQLEYMLRHGVSYWYENNLGEIAYPFNDAEIKNITISPRFRNRAGLTTVITPKTIEIHGKDWKYAQNQNDVDTNLEPKNMYLVDVHWPYSGRKIHYTYVNNEQITHPAFHFTSNQDELDAFWTLKNEYGIQNYNPIPARHEIELFQGKNSIFGPQSFPVVERVDTFHVRLNGLSLKANNGKPVKIKIKEYDASGILLGESNRDFNGVNCKPLPLYIDTSKPIFGSSNAERVYNNVDYAENHIIYRFPVATDKVKFANGTHSIQLNSEDNYEYQVTKIGANINDEDWLTFGDSSEISLIGVSSRMIVDIGFLPYRDSLTFFLRAKNINPQWNTGYSDAVSFTIPKCYENEVPKPPKFIVKGIENDTLKIKITELGIDKISGIKTYPWKFIQNLYRAQNPFVEYWQPDVLYFDAEKVNLDDVLSIPLPKYKIDITNKFEIQLYARDHTGNWAYTSQPVMPQPDRPDFEAEIVEGLPPYQLRVKINILPMMDQYIENAKLVVQSDGNDVYSGEASMSNMLNNSHWKFIQNDTLLIYDWIVDLPENTSEELLVSVCSERSGDNSQYAQKTVTIHPPMFTTVITNQNGYLELPNIAKPFDVETTRFAVGIYMANLEGQNKYQFNTVPFTSFDEKIGDKIILPLNAGDVLPKSLIGLTVEATTGEKWFTYLEQEIIPPTPKVTAELKIRNLENNRFAYDLNVIALMGAKIQQSHVDIGKAKVVLRIGSEPGKDDINVVQLQSQNYDNPKEMDLNNTGTTERTIIISDDLSDLEKIYISATGKTIYDKSADTSFVIDIPWPEKFSENARTNFDKQIIVEAIRHGARNVKGYKFSVESDGVILHPFGDKIDIATTDWQPGKDVIIPFIPTNEISLLVTIQCVAENGDVVENQLTVSTTPIPRLSVEILTNSYYTILKTTAQLPQELANQITNSELNFAFYKDDNQVHGGNIKISPTGLINKNKALPSSMEPAEEYLFKCWFWHTESQQIAQWDTLVRMPSAPLFSKIEISENMLSLPIIQIGFHGKTAVEGYKFAVGSETDLEAYREFPVEYDFAEVRIGEQLQLNQNIHGLSSKVYITLQAMATNGEIHKTTQQITLPPPTPKINSLELEKSGKFIITFDDKSFDDKVVTLDCWIREDADNPDYTIAFKQVTNPKSNRVELESRFVEEDVERVFVLEGLNIGNMINSQHFQYKFKIEKIGNNYNVLPVE